MGVVLDLATYMAKQKLLVESHSQEAALQHLLSTLAKSLGSRLRRVLHRSQLAKTYRREIPILAAQQREELKNFWQETGCR